MNWLRISALASVTLGLLGLAVHWSKSRAGFATPAACLEAYREACQVGDLERYWNCLAEPLRVQITEQHPNLTELADSLRRDMRQVKTWVQRLDAPAQSIAQVDVDEVRLDGSRRVRFHLQMIGTGWLIVGIDEPKGVPAGVPYGTHVSKVSDEP
jgi:hypothetical protein